MGVENSILKHVVWQTSNAQPTKFQKFCPFRNTVSTLQNFPYICSCFQVTFYSVSNRSTNKYSENRNIWNWKCVRVVHALKKAQSKFYRDLYLFFSPKHCFLDLLNLFGIILKFTQIIQSTRAPFCMYEYYEYFNLRINTVILSFGHHKIDSLALFLRAASILPLFLLLCFCLLLWCV